MIAYILQILLFQCLFLGLYHLVFRRTTFFSLNRAYLLGSCILSFVLPLVQLDYFSHAAAAYPVLERLTGAMVYLEGVELSAGVTQPGRPGWMFILWVLGSACTFGLLLYKLFTLARLYRKGKKTRAYRHTRISLPASEAAFSFFGWVFLGDAHQDHEADTILRHERVHVRNLHSLDLLLVELLRVPMWFNPLLWAYQQRLREVHEFQADAIAVLADKKAYYESLLSQYFGRPGLSLINPFFKNSLITKRIVMLQKSASAQSLKWNYFLVVPVIGIMLMVSACQEEQPKNQDIDPVSSRTEAPSEKQVAFAEIDQVPVYPGCEDALDKRACFNQKIQEHIMKNFNYPDEAESQGIEGRVSVIFTIASTGKITEIRQEGPHPLLEDEVARIIGRIPDMATPGMHGGQAVNVPFSIPIVFKLN